MLGSNILEVAIGLSFLFFILSLVVTSAREFIEGVTQTRAAHLERGLRELLRDPHGNGLAAQIYGHPLINSLFRGSYEPGRIRTSWWTKLRGFLRLRIDDWGRYPTRSNLPSYIPARNFAVALLDLAGRGEVGEGGAAGAHAAAAIGFEQVRAGVVENIPNVQVRRAVLLALDGAKGDLDKARVNLEAWFDSGMDRVSGWYRKHTQWVLFWIGLFLAVALNIDTFEVVRNLYQNDSVRQAIVAEAQATVQRAGSEGVRDDAAALRLLGCSPAAAAPAALPAPAPTVAPRAASGSLGALTALAPPAPPTARPAPAAQAAQAAADPRSCAQRRLDALPFPVGWGGRKIWWPYDSEAGRLNLFGMLESDFPWGSLPGWLLTAFALTLGAPFWFDLLNKMMVIRSTVKPHEKSPEEASEDRQTRQTSRARRPS